MFKYKNEIIILNIYTFFNKFSVYLRTNNFRKVVFLFI